MAINSTVAECVSIDSEPMGVYILKEVVEKYLISEVRIRSAINKGEIPCAKISGRYMFRESDIVAWIREINCP